MAKKTPKLDRRSLLTGAAAASLAAAAGSLQSESAAAQNASATGSAPGGKVSVSQRGVYEKVPLKQDVINVAAIQSQLVTYLLV